MTNMVDLLGNIKRLHKSAELVYNSEDYTSATVLYFKCLFVVLDYVILKKIGKIPKDHGERFRELEQYFPELYEVLDKYFPIYRDTYSLIIEKNKCDEIRENVKRIIKKQKIPLNN